MAQRFEEKVLSDKGIDSSRSQQFADKKTPKPTKPDETQDLEVTRKITVHMNGETHAIICENGE